LDPALFPSGAFDAFTFHGLPTPQHGGSPDNTIAHTSPMPTASLDSGLGGDMDDGTGSRTRSSSEEKDSSMTPAQSRRKAQNRAAQRAFRERKERHVRDLEAKLSALENSSSSLQTDNERLKLALQRARTENEILRATSARSPTHSRPVSANYPSPGAHLPDEDTQEPDYTVQSLPNGSVVNAAGKHHAASRHEPRGKQVPVSQAWDVIQRHPLVKQGVVDVADVVERLKGSATCDGHGPVFEESVIWQAVEESSLSGGDELI
jgi:AP-1-like factor